MKNRYFDYYIYPVLAVVAFSIVWRVGALVLEGKLGIMTGLEIDLHKLVTGKEVNPAGYGS